MTWALFLSIYAIGFILCAVWLGGMISSEPTAHGQSILIGYGCLLLIAWPLVLVWCAIVGVCCGASLLWRKLRGRA